MQSPSAALFTSWLERLAERHLAELTFPQVRRSLQALSARYIADRGGVRRGAALDGAGKRAAFALFYGPLHFMVLQQICANLPVDDPPPSRILDLGCGTGAAGAAWSLTLRPEASLSGIDLNRWAAREACLTYKHFALSGKARAGDLTRARLPGAGSAILLAFTVNELRTAQRDALKERLIEAASRGSRVLVVEPIARRLTPWWNEWCEAFQAAGGQPAEWRFSVSLPEQLRLFDKAAGLDHRELTARSLYLSPPQML